MPLLPEATVIGLVNVTLPQASNVALALPHVALSAALHPRVIESAAVLAPKTVALVWPYTVPALMYKPPENVLLPDKIKVFVLPLPPAITRAPEPSMTPLKVKLALAVSIRIAPVPLAAMVNGLVLVAVAPVYSRVPVLPLLPRITGKALLPRVPLALTLLIVAILSVPAETVSWPEKVLAPERVRVFAPVFATP